ncbi:MAG: ATPase, T2SS/T4P/T4SS family, partial [Pseudomonadota bacterium]
MPFETVYRQDRAPSTQVLLDELADAGLIAQSDKPGLAELLSKTDASVDQALAQLGLVSEEALANFYAAKFDVSRLRHVVTSIPDELVRRTNKDFLDRHRILPIARDEKIIKAVMVDPSDETAIRGLSFALDANVKPAIVTASEFERLVGMLDNESEKSKSNQTADGFSVADDASKLKDLASAEPAVRLVNRLIVDASRARASDIHIESKERDVVVRRRIDGVLTTSEKLSRAQGLTAISRLKILARLDIAERRRPQDGRIAFPIAGRPVDMRVSTTPTIHGESVVIRLLEKPAAARGLDALGFPPSNADALKRLIAQPNGILLITGPTGSGKTTTLYALLEMLAKRALKILT